MAAAPADGSGGIGPAATTDGRARRRGALRAIANPMQYATLGVAPLYLLGQRTGFVADTPLWVLLVALVGAQVFSSLATVLLPPGGPMSYVSARVTLMSLLIGVNIYLTGWGSVLAVGFVFGAAENIRVEGPRAARPAIIATLGAVVLGEVAVGVGTVPSLLPQPLGHGLGVLAAAGSCLIIALLALTTRDKERAEVSVRRSEERFRALVQHASDVIAVFDAEGKVSYVSPSLGRALEVPTEALVGRVGGDLIHPDDFERVRPQVLRVIEDSDHISWFEMRLRHADGSWRWFEAGITNLLADPSVQGLVCNMRDVTERRRFQEQLTYQAFHDSLTRLPNRDSFLERLDQALERARTRRTTVAVLFLDLDRFKLVNDSLGHEVGDRLLVDIADRLRSTLRPGDLVARFGGDEFTVLLTDIVDGDAAVHVAERITAAFREPVPVGGRELFVSTSIGIATARDGDADAGDLLRQADLAMYLAKEKGRSRWEVFDAGTAPRITERLELENDLWRALELGELTVHFQPEVSLSNGDVLTAEALVRWVHPRRGILYPDAFIPVAEESSLVVAIDRHVLRVAAEWARAWDAAGHGIAVSVNLSPRFMRQPDAVGDIRSVLRQVGVDARRLQIEITERTALTDLEATVAQLHDLRGTGVRVAIDDFGTGYSSLGYLKQLPVDVVKLDRTFVEGMDVDASDVAIAQAVITMGHALGMKVTAEGVERAEQAVRLRALGCDAAMGWHWAPALEPEALGAIIVEGFGAPDSAGAEVLPFRAVRR